MLFVSLIRWWYGFGWLDQSKQIQRRVAKTADFFSIGLCLQTLFQPFKQIDASTTGKQSLSVAVRAFLDRLFSRVFGAVIRSLLIVAGSLALGIEVFVAGLRLAVWPLIPLLPLLSLPLVITGWIPWQ
jgi:hypothetical protein